MATRESINTAKELVKKYRSITLDDTGNINVTSFIYAEYGRIKARKLTGFSSWNCPLCLAVEHDCSKCIYGGRSRDGYSCYLNENNQTYFDIVNARTDEELLDAFKNRADHIESILNKLEKGV